MRRITWQAGHLLQFRRPVLLCLFLFSNGAFSESAEETAPSVTESKSSWSQDALQNLKSPIATDSRYFLLGGMGLTATLLLFEDQIIDPFQNETVEDKPLGHFSKFGDLSGQAIPNVLYVAGMLGYGMLESDPASKNHASSMFQASLYAILASTALKYTIRERRPNSNSRDSFPSGHTTSAFAFASYVACRHAWPWGIAAYSMAGLVGYSRINDNRHYLHDVVAGAAIGGGFGMGVCFAENQRTDESNTDRPSVASSWYFSPTADGMIGGVALRY